MIVFEQYSLRKVLKFSHAGNLFCFYINTKLIVNNKIKNEIIVKGNRGKGEQKKMGTNLKELKELTDEIKSNKKNPSKIEEIIQTYLTENNINSEKLKDDGISTFSTLGKAFEQSGIDCKIIPVAQNIYNPDGSTKKIGALLIFSPEKGKYTALNLTDISNRINIGNRINSGNSSNANNAITFKADNLPEASKKAVMFSKDVLSTGVTHLIGLDGKIKYSKIDLDDMTKSPLDKNTAASFNRPFDLLNQDNKFKLDVDFSHKKGRDMFFGKYATKSGEIYYGNSFESKKARGLSFKLGLGATVDRIETTANMGHIGSKNSTFDVGKGTFEMLMTTPIVNLSKKAGVKVVGFVQGNAEATVVKSTGEIIAPDGSKLTKISVLDGDGKFESGGGLKASIGNDQYNADIIGYCGNRKVPNLNLVERTISFGNQLVCSGNVKTSLNRKISPDLKAGFNLNASYTRLNGDYNIDNYSGEASEFIHDSSKGPGTTTAYAHQGFEISKTSFKESDPAYYKKLSFGGGFKTELTPSTFVKITGARVLSGGKTLKAYNKGTTLTAGIYGTW